MSDLAELIKEHVDHQEAVGWHHDWPEALAAIRAVMGVHKAGKVYDECGHEHEYNEDGTLPDGVKSIEEIGLTCESGLRYPICQECCTDDEFQSETCASDHAHGGKLACWPCPTVRALGAALGVREDGEA